MALPLLLPHRVIPRVFMRSLRPCGVVLVGMLMGAALSCSRSGSQQDGKAAVPVTVATAIVKPMPVELRAIGTVLPSNSVTVRARVGGILGRIHFREGQDVKQGDVLFTLDRGP